MGEPLSPDRVFDFPVDELEPHPTYDFFAPGPLPRYDGNLNNNNGWLEADAYLLGELEAMTDEPMVGLMVDEIDEQMIVPVVEEVAEPMVVAEEHMVALVIDMEEDLIALFGEDDDFKDDDSKGFDEEEVGGPSTAAAEGPSFPLPAPGLPIHLVVIEDLSTHLGNLEYGHGQLVQKVIQVSDAEVATGVSIGEIGPRVFAIEGQIQVMASQMVHAADRWEQVGAQALQADVQQRDTKIQQLQTTVTEMGSRESTLMRCILGLEKRIAALEKRTPGPQ
ncbi:hypothetical protein Tco_1485131 [Tanacetum coccineum]